MIWKKTNFNIVKYKMQLCFRHEEEIIPPIELINISIETAQGKIKVKPTASVYLFIPNKILILLQQ